MKEEIIIVKDGIRIKTICQEDIEYIRQLRNKNKNYFLYSEEISKRDQIKWYEKYTKDKTDYMFIISRLINDEEIKLGVAAIYHIDSIKRECEFGRIIVDRENVCQKGMGVVITKSICDIAKEFFHIASVRLEVFDDNEPAKKTYIRAGFEINGYLCDTNTKKRVLKMIRKL